jgi:hypothetical protein
MREYYCYPVEGIEVDNVGDVRRDVGVARTQKENLEPQANVAPIREVSLGAKGIDGAERPGYGLFCTRIRVIPLVCHLRAAQTARSTDARPSRNQSRTQWRASRRQIKPSEETKTIKRSRELNSSENGPTVARTASPASVNKSQP